jgi:hypothetical protein
LPFILNGFRPGLFRLHVPCDDLRSRSWHISSMEETVKKPFLCLGKWRM